VDGSKVAPGDEADTVSGWGGSTDVSKYFDEYGVINADGKAFSSDINVGGEKVTLTFATTQQYVVEYRGDAKYISMVKKTGGVDKATDTVNQTGQDVFGTDIFDAENSPASGTAMLNELLYAVAKIDSADYHWAANDGLTISDAAHAQVLGAQTTMAARQQAYTAASDMLTTQDESITSDITDVSSTDVAYLATKLMEYQTIYSLSLSVGSKILPGTLADYLH
jgi:flagellar hook-associated protein 3 FlgL